MKEITVTRKPVCAADDQTLPLELVLQVSETEAFSSFIQRIIGAGFLQFSSTHTCAIGFVGSEPVARVLANFSTGPVVEFVAPAAAATSAVVPSGLLEFRWSGSNNSSKPT
ncbi:hypothetical protein, partial [Cognatilysobacter terrigena]|uniref:hypothetical protein n=1 Tax=Cognatilysobacter terrigena TaxID=2488749 RepID=UPI001AACC3BD